MPTDLLEPVAAPPKPRGQVGGVPLIKAPPGQFGGGPATSAGVDLLAPQTSAPVQAPPRTAIPPVSTPPTPITPVSAPIPAAPARTVAPEPVDLLSPAPSSVNNLAPLMTHEAQQATNDQTFFQAHANLAGYPPQVNNLAQVPGELQNQDLENFATAIQDQHRRRVLGWFEQRASREDGNWNAETTKAINEQNKTDPFPADSLRYLPPDEQQILARRLREHFADPALATAAQVAPGWNLPEHAAATWKGDVPALAEDVAAKQAENFTDFGAGLIPGGVIDPAQGRQMRIDLQKAADERRQAAQTIRQGLPQTEAAQFTSGTIDLAGQMGVTAAVGAITKDPKLAGAVFTGLFSPNRRPDRGRRPRIRGSRTRKPIRTRRFQDSRRR